MAENDVSVTITAKDDTGTGFGSAEGRAKAFEAAITRSYASQARAAKLLNDANKLLAESERGVGDQSQRTGDKTSWLGGIFSSLTNAMSNTQIAGVSLQVWALAIIPALVGVGAALFPLIASLGLVAVGIGTFAAIAIPEISKVWAAVSKGGAAWAALSPAEKAAGREARGLHDEFRKLSAAVQPQILQAFDSALRILKDLMPALRPLVIAAGKALDGLLSNIDNWLKSGSGKKFIHWMEVDGPKAIATFGRVVWDIIRGVGRTFDFLYNTGEAFIRGWRRLLHLAAMDIDGLRLAWINAGHAIEAAWNHLVSAARTTWSTIVSGFRAAVGLIRSAWAVIYNDLVRPVENAYHTIVGIIHTIEGAFSGLVGAVSHALGGIPGMINNALGGIPGKVLGFLGLASGGIVGAAAGGIRSNMVMVGERGRELVQLPAGSRVFNNSQTEGMLAAAGGGGVTYVIHNHVPPTVNMAEVGRVTVEAIREFERRSGKGWRS